MPSRIRVVLTHKNGTVLAGKRAVYQLYQSFSPGRAAAIRKAFPTRLGRLLEAVKEMDPNWVLTLIREAKGTRKSRSLYWKMKKGALERGIPQLVGGQAAGGMRAVAAQLQAQQRVWQQVVEPAIIVDEEGF